MTGVEALFSDFVEKSGKLPTAHVYDGLQRRCCHFVQQVDVVRKGRHSGFHSGGLCHVQGALIEFTQEQFGNAKVVLQVCLEVTPWPLASENVVYSWIPLMDTPNLHENLWR